MQVHFKLPAYRTLELVFFVVSSMGAIWYVSTLRFASGDLNNNLWRPAHLLVHGQSPYHTCILSQTECVTLLPALWLPMAIGLFFPLGWLTVYQASLLWCVGSIAILIVIVWLAGGMRHPPLTQFALGALSVFMFPPVLSHLMLGQFAVLASLALLLAAHFVTRPRYLLTGFLVAVSLAKPQLGVLVVPGLALAFSRLHRLRGLISFSSTVVLWIILLTIPLWIAYPSWFNDFVTAQGQNLDWAHPSLFMLLRIEWGTVGLFLWSVLAVGVFGANIRLWLTRPPENAVIWSLALTTLITPYIWSWDFTMLVPLIVYAVFRFKSRVSRAVLGVGYLFCWSLMIWIRFNTDNSDHRFWWLPWLIVASVYVGHLMDAEPAAELGTTESQPHSLAP